MSKCADGTDGIRRECSRTREDVVGRCVEERDQGYNRCAQTREDRYKQCCDWAPCSWFCRAFWFIVNIVCVAWEWVSNVVCVAYEWIKNVVCVAYTIVIVAFCGIVDAIVSVVGVFVTAIEAALGWALSAVGFVVAIITSIPVIGRAVSWLLNIAHEIVNAIASIPDAVLTLLGIMPEKKLRLAVIVQNDSEGRPVVTDELARRAVRYVINTFRSELNVRVIPLAYASYQSADDDETEADGRFLYHDDGTSSDRLLDVCCDACAAGDDLLTIGADFHIKLARTTFWGNARRLIGYGAPVVAFAVRRFTDGKAGCSLGPLTDWVTVRFQDSNAPVADADLTDDKSLGSITDLAHEVAHACNLWHVNDADLLINPSPPRKGGFTIWQKVMVRASRHVTYF